MSKDLKKILKNACIFVILAIVTGFVIFNSVNVSDVVKTIAHARIGWLLLGALCMCVFIGGEAVNFRRTLSLTGDKVRFSSCLKYAVTGYFFSAVTPSSSGGQPMQAYYMHLDGINLSRSALALFAELAAFQLTVLVYALCGFVAAFNMVAELPLYAKIVLLIGVLLNSIILLFMLSALFSKPLAQRVARLIHRLLRLVRLKKADEIYENTLLRIDEYHLYSRCLKGNGALMAKTLATSLVKVGASYSVYYCVYRAIGLSECSFGFVFALAALLFVSVSALPLPGAVGLSESAFVLLLGKIYPPHLMGGALVLTRTVNFYLFVLITGIAVSIFILTHNVERNGYNYERSDN